MYGKRFDVSRKYKHENNFKTEKSIEGAILDHGNHYTSGKMLEIEDEPLTFPKVIAANGLKVWFDLEIDSSSKKHDIVNNFSIAVIEKLQIMFGVKEIQCIDHFNIFALYLQRWLTKNQRQLMLDQGIDDEDKGAINKLRLGFSGGNLEQQKMAKIYKNRFCFPISNFFEGLQHLPFLQSKGNFPLKLHLTLAKNENVLKDAGANGKPGDAKYKLFNLDFEREILTNTSLHNLVESTSFNRRYLYDKITSHNSNDFDKTSKLWQLDIDTPTDSLKAVVLIFIDEDIARKEYACDNEIFYNPDFTRIDIQATGNNHALYTDGMKPSHMYDAASSIFKFSEDSLMTPKKFMTDGFALVLNFKTIEDKEVHGTGKAIDGNGKIHLEMKRIPESSAGKVTCYSFTIREASVTISPSGIITSEL